MFRSFLLVSFLFLVLGGATEAARRDQRQGNQKQRIQQGVKSGELTSREAKRMRQDQRQINRKEKKFEADGEVSASESAKLEKMQDKASKRIYRQKHDGQKAKDDAGDDDSEFGE